MRRAAKVDLSHKAIVEHLRNLGWSVWSTASLGGDFPDLVVARHGYTALVECKSGSEGGAEMKLSEGQREFRDKWQGAVVVAATPEQAERELSARLLGFRLEELRIAEAGVD